MTAGGDLVDFSPSLTHLSLKLAVNSGGLGTQTWIRLPSYLFVYVRTPAESGLSIVHNSHFSTMTVEYVTNQHH